MEGDEIINPGYWTINLKVDQAAIYITAYSISNIVWMDEWNKKLLEEQGIYLDPGDFQTIAGHQSRTAAVNPLDGTYVAPDNFKCPVPEGETFRFTKPLPTLPPILAFEVTTDTLPSGYQWPPHVREYVLDEHNNPTTELAEYSGYIYPTGFTRGDYYAPPYIDVRHVKHD